LLNISYFLLLV